MIGDAAQYPSHVGFRIDAVQFRRSEQTVDRRCTFSAGIRTCEQIVLPSRTSSIFAIYSSLSSATHHNFFPPRLEVVVEEQNPDGFSSRSRNQPPLQGFLGHQAHSPPGATLRRASEDRGDNVLFLAGVQ
jgi:hypothetical protein